MLLRIVGHPEVSLGLGMVDCKCRAVSEAISYRVNTGSRTVQRKGREQVGLLPKQL